MLDAIRDAFAAYFGPGGPRLPEAALASRKRGAFDHGAWSVQYLFGQEGGRAFLDFYATNRFTNDRHVRLFEGGAIEALDSPLDSYGFDADIPGDQERAQKEYGEYNRRVYAMLRAKGFGLG